VNPLVLPHWPELAVRHAIAQFPENSKLFSYLPAFGPEKMPPRTWFWGVVSNVEPEWTDQFLARARANRSQPKTKKLFGENSIEIQEEWIHALLQHDFLSSSKCLLSFLDLLLVQTSGSAAAARS